MPEALFFILCKVICGTGKCRYPFDVDSGTCVPVAFVVLFLILGGWDYGIWPADKCTRVSSLEDWPAANACRLFPLEG